MSATAQPPNFSTDFKIAMEPLKFAGIVRFIVERRGLTWKEAAKLCGITLDRMEKLAQGKNCPLAADAIRLQDGLGIKWKASDFEDRGFNL